MTSVANVGWCARSGAFAGLDPAERRALKEWLRRNKDVDGVEDFSGRPWDIAGAETILGLFQKGAGRASWLVIRGESGWLLGRCANNTVSYPPQPLQDTLELISAAQSA